MTIRVLESANVSEVCYLWEAVLWATVYRYPLTADCYDMFDPQGISHGDARGSSDQIDSLEPLISCSSLLTTDECTFVGLPTNPAYEIRGDYRHSISELERNVSACGPEARLHWEKELAAARDIDRRQREWDKSFQSLIDPHQARLFVALREGRLPAKGIRLPAKTIAESTEIFGRPDWRWSDQEWEAIPSNFWRSRDIYWRECFAEGNGNAYGQIQVAFEDLEREFPPPPAEPANDVVKIAATLVLAPNRAPSKEPSRTRGRPAMDWDGFHAEVAMRIRDTGLPAKREAFIAEMLEWCQKKWGKEVGRSTVFQKLKRYYDRFGPKSENVRK